MPRNGSGTYTRTDGTYTGATVFAQEAANGIDIEAVRLDTEAQDMADAITASIAKDGQTTPTANLPMGGFKHTSCGAPTADDQYVTRGFANTQIRMGLEWKTGLQLSNAADADHDITVTAGAIMDTNNVYRITSTSSFTKRIDATWAAGTNAGGLSDDDSLGNDTWYGVWMLGKSTDATAFEYIFATTRAKSLSDAAASAAGYDISRLIGAVLTDGSANIIPFGFDGDDWYRWKSPLNNELNLTGTNNQGVLTIYAPPNMLGRISFIATGVGVQTVVYFGADADGYVTPTTNNFFDISLNSGTNASRISTQKIMNVGASSQIKVSVNKDSSDDQGYNANTQAWKFLPTVTDLV